MKTTPIRSMSMMVLIAFSLSSCATEPSHESFFRALNSSIGRSVDSDPFGNYCSVRSLSMTGINTLPNGYEEHKHVRGPIRNVGACPYSCEVDPKTRTVVAVHIEGSAQNCVQFP